MNAFQECVAKMENLTPAFDIQNNQSNPTNFYELLVNFGNYRMFKHLCNLTDSTLLMLACANNQQEIAIYLIKEGNFQYKLIYDKYSQGRPICIEQIGKRCI
eukprot:403369372